MNIDKAKKVAFEYAYHYKEMYNNHAKCNEYEATRFEAQAIRPEVHEAIQHILWMVNEMQSFTSEGKVMRWLGFIQGCMWVLGSKSIKELKTDNYDTYCTCGWKKSQHPNNPMGCYVFEQTENVPSSPLEYNIDELAEVYELYYGRRR